MKKFWAWLDGKKTAIAAFYWGAGGLIIMVWFPQGLPYPYNKINLTVGITLSALGLGHMAVKALIPKEITDQTPDQSK